MFLDNLTNYQKTTASEIHLRDISPCCEYFLSAYTQNSYQCFTNTTQLARILLCERILSPNTRPSSLT